MLCTFFSNAIVAHRVRRRKPPRNRPGPIFCGRERIYVSEEAETSVDTPNSKVLILDDSTSAVDTKTDAAIQRAFAEYIPDTTKIIIAQRVSSVQNADKIVVLNDGKIDAVGTHEELLKNCNIYREVYRSQVKGDGENE